MVTALCKFVDSPWPTRTLISPELGEFKDYSKTTQEPKQIAIAIEYSTMRFHSIPQEAISSKFRLENYSLMYQVAKINPVDRVYR
jgi:hypothetical protein